MTTFILFALCLWWLVAAGLSSYLAQEKGYFGGLWLLYGFLAAPVALLAAVGLPDRRPSDG